MTDQTHTAVIDQLNPQAIVGHVASAGAVSASIFGWLPPVLTGLATLAAILWYSIAIWESKTAVAIRQRIRNRLHRPPAPAVEPAPPAQQ